MSRLEFVERLPSSGEEQRWLVHVEEDVEPRVAWLLLDEEREWLEQTAQETRPWLGWLHPRVSQIFEIAWLGQTLAFVIDDDRGPRFVQAAARLTDPIDRERWCVAQIIAIGDALATMRQRDRAFVHRRLELDHVFVDAAGHARLRAPIAMVAQGPRRSYVGRGKSMGPYDLMSPEQCRGLRLTPASEVFSLAGHLFAALTGTRPFRRDTDFGTLQAILQEPPPPLVTHAPGLAQVIARALEKDRAHRYPDPGTFAGELWRCVPDAAEYDECLSDVIAAWWPTAAPARPARPPTGRCRMAWAQLDPTARDDVRRCASCDQDVVRVGSLAAIVPLVGRRCVSYTGGD